MSFKRAIKDVFYFVSGKRPDMADIMNDMMYSNVSDKKIISQLSKFSVEEISQLINPSVRYNQYLLLQAYKYNRKEVFNWMLDKGVNPHVRNSKGFNLVAMSVVKDDIDTLKKVASLGVNINIPDYKENYPLHIAVSLGNVKAVDALLSLGVNLHAKDSESKTARQNAESLNVHKKAMIKNTPLEFNKYRKTKLANSEFIAIRLKKAEEDALKPKEEVKPKKPINFLG